MTCPDCAGLRAEVERLQNEGIDSHAAEAMEQTWRAKYAAARADADRLAEALGLMCCPIGDEKCGLSANAREALRLHEEGSTNLGAGGALLLGSEADPAPEPFLEGADPAPRHEGSTE